MTDNNKRFIINKGKGVVICELSGCANIALHRIYKYVKYVAPINGDYVIPDTFIGVAYCAPEDEFDEEIGKYIAMYRAKKKRNMAINKAIRNFLWDMGKDAKNLANNGIHLMEDDDE